MKKFFKKKAVMFGSIVAAAVVLVLLVAFCVRPVSVGYTYKHYDEERKVTTTYHFDTLDKVTMKMDAEGTEDDVEMKFYYLVKDGCLVVLYDCLAEDYEVNGVVARKAATKEELKAAKEEALKDWDKKEERDNGIRVNAFSLAEYDEGKADEDYVAKCAGAVATVVVLAVLEVALLGAVAYAVLVSKKK